MDKKIEPAESVLAKYRKAVKNKTNNGFMEELEEAYKFCCPRRYNKDLKTGKEVFDSTAVYAVQARAAANHDSIFPAFREWIAEEPVSKYGEADKISIARKIQKRVDNAHKAIELSNFHIEIEDTLTDALFSDGAILVFTGTPECPLRFLAVDWYSFYSLNDLNGEPTNNFMVRKLSLAAIKYYWPKADLSEIGNQQNKDEIDVVDGYTYNEILNRYTYSVFVGDKRIYATEEKSSPWVVFNQKRRAQYKCGWGQVLDSMPNVQTTNKVEGYILQHGAINVAGIWQADDDGVLNVDNIKLVPGAIIPKAVGSQGLQPLHSKLDMNLTQFILSDEKDAIRKAIQGSALPDFSSGVRTASEYQLRDAEMKKTEIPNMLQLAQGAKRLMRRIFDILESPAMRTSELYCEKVKDSQQRVIRTSFTSPLIRMKDQIQMKESIQVIAIGAQMFGQAAYENVNADEFLKDFYIKNNLKAKYIREGEDLENYRTQNRKENIELAQAGVKQTQPNPGNISF